MSSIQAQNEKKLLSCVHVLHTALCQQISYQTCAAGVEEMY